MAGDNPERNENDADSDAPLLQKSEDSEFKFFQLVEDTIIGLAVFMSSFWTFLAIMIARPSEFGSEFENNRDKFPKPFTLLLLMVIFSSIQIQRVYVFFVSYFDRTGNAFHHPSLQSSFENLSFFTALKVALPIVIIVIIFSVLIVRLIKNYAISIKRKLFYFLIYLSSLQFFFVGVFFYSIELTMINEDWIFRDRDFGDPILEIGITGLAPLIVLLFGLLYTIINCIKIIWPICDYDTSRDSHLAFKSMSLAILILLPVLGLTAALLSEYIGWAGVTGVGWVELPPKQ